MSASLQIKRLVQDGEIAAAFSLMAVLRPHLVESEFVDVVRAQQREGYELVGLFDDGRLVCLAGIRDGRTLSRGPHLFVDDLVTAADVRGQGYGKGMLRWIAQQAAERRLGEVWLDSRDTAVGFYQQLGFRMSTSVPCRIASEQLLKDGGGDPS